MHPRLHSAFGWASWQLLTAPVDIAERGGDGGARQQGLQPAMGRVFGSVLRRDTAGEAQV